MNDAPVGFGAAPTSVKIMSVVLGIEALVAVAVGLWIGIEAFGEEGSHIVGTLFLAVLALGLAVFLAAAVRGMLRRHAWSRGAAIAWQVLQVGIALGTWNGGRGILWLALTLLAPAVIVLVCVFRQSVSDWLAREAPAG